MSLRALARLLLATRLGCYPRPRRFRHQIHGCEMSELTGEAESE